MEFVILYSNDARAPLSNRRKNLNSCIVIYMHIMVMLIENICELVHLIALTNINIPRFITYVFDDFTEERMYD